MESFINETQLRVGLGASSSQQVYELNTVYEAAPHPFHPSKLPDL
jgi:hypothetical protein